MVSTDNKKWWIVGGAVALLGAAIVWQSFQDEAAEQAEEKLDDDDIMELLKAEKLDVVKKDGNLIQTQYFLELLQFIITTVKEQDKGNKQKQIDKRRKALEDGDEKLYTNIVREMIMQEEAASQEFMQKVMETVQVDQREFEMTHQKLMSNPRTQELVMMAQQGQLKQQKPGQAKAPTLTKGKTMQYIKELRETSKEKMAAMQAKQSQMEQQQQMGGDPMEMMVMMMVEQAKMTDEQFKKTKIEQHQFEDSLMYFCQSDQEVKMAMQMYMMEMQQQMGPQGGPGGMPGR